MISLTNITKNKHYYKIIIILILLCAAFRFVFIHADAPPDITFSAAIYTDEGFKTYAARNYVLYDNWKWSPDEQYESWLKQSPLATWTYVKAFQLFGANIFSIRIVSILYSIATMFIFFLFLLRRFDRETALLGLVLLGTNYFSIMYNRLGFYETQLNFYIILSIFGISEAFTRKNNNTIKFISLAIGVISFAAAFYIKVSYIIAFIAMLPAAWLFFFNKKQVSEKKLNFSLIVIMSIILCSYLLLAYLSNIAEALKIFVNDKLFGEFVIKTFDPIHVAIGKAFYSEFIISQPFTFFIGLFFAIYTFYNYIFNKSKSHTELFLSSWMLFGFLVLNLLSYHPSRYFLILTLPIIALTARALIINSGNQYQAFAEQKQPFPFNIMKILLFVGILINAGMALLLNLIPYSLKNVMSRKLYSYIILVHGEIYASVQNKGLFLYVLIVVVLFLMYMTVTLLLLFKRKKLIGYLAKINFQKFFLICIIILQMFLYGKWLLFHESKLYTVSNKLEKILPKNAIIFGSWSAGLVMNNNLRSIILQTDCGYNQDLVAKLIARQEIPIYQKSNGKVTLKMEKDQPLYLVVCPTVVFEKHITQLYKQYIIPKNLVLREAFGYFDIEMYKIH